MSVARSESRRRIVRRLARARAEVAAPVLDGLVAYLDLLAQWNRKINLTAELDSDAAVDRLIVEPVVASRWVPPTATVVDIGSGNGSPAIPIKLAQPGIRLTMVEAKTRKAAFLREVIRRLALAEAVAEASRFQHLIGSADRQGAADLVTVRAVRVDRRTLEELARFLRPDGEIFLFGGSSTPVRDSVPAALEPCGTEVLVEPLRSHLFRFRKVVLTP